MDKIIESTEDGPEKLEPTKCTGPNCNAVNGCGHSLECEIQHDMEYACLIIGETRQ